MIGWQRFPEGRAVASLALNAKLWMVKALYGKLAWSMLMRIGIDDEPSLPGVWAGGGLSQALNNVTPLTYSRPDEALEVGRDGAAQLRNRLNQGMYELDGMSMGVWPGEWHVELKPMRN